jgi:cytochrome c
MDDRKNTIAMMVLAAGIVALGGSIATGEFFHAERPEKMGYVVEGVEVEGEGGGEAAKPIEFYLASADPAKGAEVFKKCAACHTDSKGGPNGLGPNLWGTVGKPHGHVAGFAYSDALKGKPGNWDWKALDEWLTSPKKYAPGTKMTFAGLSKPEDRANLIAFLNKQSDAPLAPASGEAVAGAVPAQTEAQAAKQPEDNIAGEGAPATSGREAQEKTH